MDLNQLLRDLLRIQGQALADYAVDNGFLTSAEIVGKTDKEIRLAIWDKVEAKTGETK
jgi:hypothetical protein